MPLNEIEQHPYLNYFIDAYGGESQVPWSNFKKMIIGSFPVYEVTRTIYPQQDRSNSKDNWLNFFYGSETNQFWDRMCAALESSSLREIPESKRKDSAIALLNQNGILLTDAIFQTNRHDSKKDGNPFSPEDQSLMNTSAMTDIKSQFLLNDKLLDWLWQAKNINSLFFTAQKSTEGKNPGGWFHQLLRNQGFVTRLKKESHNYICYTLVSPSGQITRDIELFFLPSPASFRSIPLTANRKHRMFVRYLTSADPILLEHLNKAGFKKTLVHNQQLTQHRDRFISLWWRSYLIDMLSEFDGNV